MQRHSHPGRVLCRTLGSIKRMFGGTGSPLAPLRPRPPAGSPGWSLRTFSVTAAAGGPTCAPFFRTPSVSSMGSPAETPRGSPPGAPCPPSNLAAPRAGAGEPREAQVSYLNPSPAGNAARWGGETESPAGSVQGSQAQLAKSPEVGAGRRRGSAPRSVSAAGPERGSRGSAEGPLGLGMSQNLDPGADTNPVSGSPGLGFGWSGTPEAFRAPMRAGLANLPSTPPVLPRGGPQVVVPPVRPPARVPLSPKMGNVGGAAPTLPPWKAEALASELPQRPALGAAARATAGWKYTQ